MILKILSIASLLWTILQAPSDSTVTVADASGSASDSTSLATAAADTSSAVAVTDSIAEYYKAAGLWELPDADLADIDSACFAMYDSLWRTLPDTTDIRRLIRRQKKEYRDSVRIATPRILSTFAFPDSLRWRRVLTWTADTRFNEPGLRTVDSLYNAHIHDNPVYRQDVNASYQGVVGSAAQLFNFFRRQEAGYCDMINGYLPYSFTPASVPQYNAKNPYVELGYWGTPFSLQKKEEMSVLMLITQNITPSFNFTINYRKFGGRGMLQREMTDNRTLAVTANYLGKKYMANGGIINQRVTQEENGGVTDTKWITDTIVDPKEIAVNLTKANSNFRRTTFFINQTLAVPMNFLRKGGDSLSVSDGTAAYIGHYGEITSVKRAYYDQISDAAGRGYYHDVFNINARSSADSLSVLTIDNKLFIKLQPFSADAIVSKINGGAGYVFRNYYQFTPDQYVFGRSNILSSNFYVYAGASGQFRKYFRWNADGQYYLIGGKAGDFDLGGNVKFSVYPLPGGVHLTGSIRLSNTSPDPFKKRMYLNHHSWDKPLGRFFENRLTASLGVPDWKLNAGAGYSVTTDRIYYDATGEIAQADHPVNVFSAWLEKDFKLGIVHLDHRLLYQATSDDEVVPLPAFSANLRYYIQFDVVKGAMEMQIGADATYYTKYYGPGYMPDLGVFYNQRQEQFGDALYVDPFVNVQWKEVSFFIKYTNVLMGTPNNDRFSCYGHIRPEKFLKFGVFWPF